MAGFAQQQKLLAARRWLAGVVSAELGKDPAVDRAVLHGTHIAFVPAKWNTGFNDIGLLREATRATRRPICFHRP